MTHVQRAAGFYDIKIYIVVLLRGSVVHDYHEIASFVDLTASDLLKQRLQISPR